MHNLTESNRNAEFVKPKNEDLRNISLGLQFCILTDLKCLRTRHSFEDIKRGVFIGQNPIKSIYFTDPGGE